KRSARSGRATCSSTRTRTTRRPRATTRRPGACWPPSPSRCSTSRRRRCGEAVVMAPSPYAWLGDVQTFLDTPEDEILRKLTSFAKETGAPQVLAWDRTLRTLRDELGACLPDAARFALV